MCLALPGRILSIRYALPDELPDDAEVASGNGTAVRPAPATADASPPSTPDADPLWRTAEVDFGGVCQRVSLACLPEARVGDLVLVHVGIALSVVEEEEAATLRSLAAESLP